MRKRISVFLLLVSLIAVGLPHARARAANTVVLLSPFSQNIAVGQLAYLTLSVQDVENLYGYQTTIAFNPSLLEVVDADTSKTGIQVALGTFLQADFVQQNNADNSTGRINCVVSQLAPAGPVSGSGDLLTITFKGKAVGTSAIQFADIKLAQANGMAIDVTRQEAQIAVGGGTPPTETPTFTPTPTPTGPTSTPTATSPVGTPTPTTTPTPTGTLQPGQTIIHVVRTGDTLYSIARRYGVTVQAIAHLNGIVNTSYIRVGQELIIPRDGWVTPVSPTPQPGPTLYVVQLGDTLYSISRRYGTTVEAIALANNIANPSRIYAGQQLTIPGGSVPWPTPPPSGQVHVVQPGETLCSIARRYGTTFWAIAIANNLSNPNIIYPGQQLVIP